VRKLDEEEIMRKGKGDLGFLNT